VLESFVGFATNAEVKQVLEERGSDSAGDKDAGIPSERKVHAYLKEQCVRAPAQDRLKELHEELKAFKLTKAEIVQIINLQPTTQVEVHLIVDDCEERLSDEQVDALLDKLESFAT